MRPVIRSLAVVLTAVALLTGGAPIQFLGAGAVVLSFAHAQVADRLAESAARQRELAVDGVRARTSSDVAAHYVFWNQHHATECHHWATRYLVGKELLWLAYFIALGAWSALAGVALFLAYPAWRRLYRGST